MIWDVGHCPINIKLKLEAMLSYFVIKRIAPDAQGLGGLGDITVIMAKRPSNGFFFQGT